MAAPPPRVDTADTKIWGSQKAVKFDILPTGTTFGAGLATASNDPVTHNTLSAEQKLYGPLHLDHRGDRCRPAAQQQEHHRQLQAELVKPAAFACGAAP